MSGTLIAPSIVGLSTALFFTHALLIPEFDVTLSGRKITDTTARVGQRLQTSTASGAMAMTAPRVECTVASRPLSSAVCR